MTTTSGKILASAVAFFVAGAVLLAGSPAVLAQDTATVEVSVKNGRFQPAEPRAPAGKPITLRIKNLDPTPMEFESVSLRVEKVVDGNSEAAINLRPLQPGRYGFFDDFHPQTKGTLVVQ
jgi:hypothetical protein